MSEIGYTPESHEDDDLGAMALSALTLVQELTMDEDPAVDRPDIWYISWSDVREPIEDDSDESEVSHRNTAMAQIHQLYIESLGVLYPKLAKAKTMDEFDKILATIPDVPECDGSFSASYFLADNGNQRSLTYVDARVGDHTAMSIYISDIDPDIIKSYNLTLLPDNTILGSSAMSLRNIEQQEIELLKKIEPSQRNTLLRIMYGNMMPDEVEMRLIEIKVLSMGITPEAELDEIIQNAHSRYEAAVKLRDDQAMTSMIALTMGDYEHIHEILDERMAQLG